jgi:hypothetical protein
MQTNALLALKLTERTRHLQRPEDKAYENISRFSLLQPFALGLARPDASKKTRSRQVWMVSEEEHRICGKGSREWESYQGLRRRVQTSTKAPRGAYQKCEFEQNKRIGEARAVGRPKLFSFRDYRPVWHEQSCVVNSHYQPCSLFVSADGTTGRAGWLFHQLGYAPKAFYAYVGPILTLITICPDQVVANVQGRACNRQGIIGATSMAARDSFTRGDRKLTSVTTGRTKPRRLIRPTPGIAWNGLGRQFLSTESCGPNAPAAAFRVQKNVDGRRPLGSAADKDVNHPRAALPAQRSGYNAGRRK